LLAGAEFIAMTHWKLTLAYDGSPYRGWQVQPNLPTVQGLLSDAIHRTTGERVLPQGSGRTDAGVHALAQVASFSLAAPIPAANLHRALNRCLPPSIRVLAVEAVPPAFHARHSALRKTYEYRIFPLRAPSLEPRASSLEPRTSNLEPDPDLICPPILAPTVWPCPWPLDLAALNQAAAHVLGTHDFTSFAAADPDLTSRKSSPFGGSRGLQPPEAAQSIQGALAPGFLPQPTTSNQQPTTPVRTITYSQWRAADNLLLYRITADGFLHHMVRNLVGTFVQAGAHRISPDSIPTLLAARDRAVAGPTAPASGLFLVLVDYPTPPTLSS
jgi:tRNA pseudouridine38-40 synthase